MIHPQGAEASSEEFTGPVVVVGGAGVVVGASVGLVLGGLLVVVLGGRLVDVVEGSAMAVDSEVAVLVVVVLTMGSLVELAIGNDTAGSPDPDPDPQPAATSRVMARRPATPTRWSSPALVRSILTSVRLRVGKLGRNMPHQAPRIQGNTTEEKDRMERLMDKVAIVTGGGGGIGGATARALAREGASVVVVDIDHSAAERVTKGIAEAGGNAVAFRADLSDEDQVVATIAAATSSFGRLDVLHNNAALTDSDFLTRDTAVTDLALDVWDRTLEVNLRSQMLTCKHAVPEMVRGGGGSIINMSSGASLKGDRTRTAYGVSKAGVNALTMYVATSHGKQGIRVNTILPGLIITDAVRAHLDEKMLAGLGKATLTPDVGQPEDIADVVVFLASDESRYITGQMLAVDGGMSAHVGLGTDG